MKKTVLFIIILTFVGKVSGFLREALMASRIGANVYTDIYNYSSSVIILFTALVLTGMYTALVPVLSTAEQEGKMNSFFDKVLSFMTPFLMFMMFLVLLLAPQLLAIVAPGLEDSYLQLAIRYTRFLSLNVFLVGMQSIIVGYLQKNNSFLHAASLALPLNGGIILGILLSSPDNIGPLILGSIAGEFMALLWLLSAMRKTDYHFQWNGAWRGDPHIKLFFAMVAPVMISLAATQINLVIDRALASLLPKGSASYLSYASKLQTIFFSVIVVSLMTVLFTKQSELASEKNYKEIYQMTKKNLSLILLIIVPITFGLMLLNQEVAQIAYMRDKFTFRDASITGWLLCLYAGVILFQTVGDMLTKMLFALKETRKPMITTLVGIGVNITLNVILMRLIGIYGLALATCLSAMVRMILSIYYSSQYYRKDIGSMYTSSIGKYFVGSILMIVVLWLLKHYTPLGSLGLYPYTFISIFIGVFVYFLVLRITKTQELTEAKELGIAYLSRFKKR